MTKLQKNAKLCTSQLFVVIILPTYSTSQSPTLIPEEKKSFSLSIFCFAQRNLSISSIIFLILCLQEKSIFQRSYTLFENVARSLRSKTLCKGILRSPKKVISKYHAQKIVDTSTSLHRGRQRWSINAIFSCNFCMSLCKKWQQYINDLIYDR